MEPLTVPSARIALAAEQWSVQESVRRNLEAARIQEELLIRRRSEAVIAEAERQEAVVRRVGEGKPRPKKGRWERGLKPYPAPPQWRLVQADDPRPWLDKSVRTVRGRGKWRETERWELPFPELVQAWNTWLVFRKYEHGPWKKQRVYELAWWGLWEEYD